MPMFISTLMTSAAFTDILCAKSATEIVSGIGISRMIGSEGATNVDSSFSSLCFDLDLGERHPEATLESPRPLSARFLNSRSDQSFSLLSTCFSLVSTLTPAFEAGR